MIQRYYFNTEINEESFQDFINFQNSIDKDAKLEVWLDSCGGECMYSEMLKLIFEAYKSEDFQLVGAGNLLSSALDLFVGTECVKYLVPGTIGMVHTITRNAPPDTKGKIKMKFSEEVCYNREYPLVESMNKKINTYLSKEQKVRYDNNEDIWISYDDILKFLT